MLLQHSNIKNRLYRNVYKNLTCIGRDIFYHRLDMTSHRLKKDEGEGMCSDIVTRFSPNALGMTCFPRCTAPALVYPYLVCIRLCHYPATIIVMDRCRRLREREDINSQAKWKSGGVFCSTHQVLILNKNACCFPCCCCVQKSGCNNSRILIKFQTALTCSGRIENAIS